MKRSEFIEQENPELSEYAISVLSDIIKCKLTNVGSKRSIGTMSYDMKLQIDNLDVYIEVLDYETSFTDAFEYRDDLTDINEYSIEELTKWAHKIICEDLKEFITIDIYDIKSEQLDKIKKIIDILYNYTDEIAVQLYKDGEYIDDYQTILKRISTNKY